MTIKERIINWLAGEDVAHLRFLHKRGKETNDYLRRELGDLRNRVADRDAGVVRSRYSGRLPEPKFLGVIDYGKGVTKEDSLSYDTIKVAGSGLVITVENGQVTIRGPKGDLMCALTNRSER